MLSVAATRELAVAELAPLMRDMTPVRTGWWARPAGDEHFAMLGLLAWKGGRLILAYGVSCAYVPHWPGAEWRWHRTLAQAQPDLWVDSLLTGRPRDVAISQLRGERAAREDARRLLDQMGGTVTAFWAATSTPAGVRDAALAQADPDSRLHTPHPFLVAAFAAARLGDLPGARGLLDRCAHLLPASALATAPALLEQVATAA
ncbi:MAG: hypothetical protein ACJ73S_16015 [Mycobacteriales bacterium]